MRGGENVVNGIPLLFFNEQRPNQLSGNSGGNGDIPSEQKDFSTILASIKEPINNQEVLTDESLLLLVQQISELLQSDELTGDNISELLESLNSEEALTSLIDVTFLKELILSVQELMQITPNLSETDLFEQVMAQIKNDSKSNDVANQLINDQNIFAMSPRQLSDLQMLSADKNDAAKQLHQQFNTLMQSIDSEETLIWQAPKILKLLEEWQELSRKLRLPVAESESTVDDNNKQLWEQLVNRFTKRTNQTLQATYNNESKVTTRNIAEWVKYLAPKLLSQSSLVRDGETNSYHNLNTKMMSPLEQYVIYMQRTEDHQLVDHQLVKQLRQIVKTNQLTQMQPITNQFVITLKPDNLGEMLVRFIEVNGEMTVKILVTSQATKSILEANVHQLKHMFAPHQVVIEKVTEDQEVIPKEDSSMEEQDDREHSEKQQEESHESSHEETQLDFRKILNEVV